MANELEWGERKNQRKTYENEYKENVEIEKEESEVKGEECQIEIDFPIEIDESAKKRPITDCAETDRSGFSKIICFEKVQNWQIAGNFATRKWESDTNSVKEADDDDGWG